MSLRLRVALAAAVAVLIAIVVSSAALYFGVREHIYDQIDSSLSEIRTTPGAVTSLRILEHTLKSGKVPDIPEGQQQPYLQFVDRAGNVVAHLSPTLLPVTPAVKSVAQGAQTEAFFNATMGGSPVRVFALQLGDGTALEIGHSLEETTAALHDLLVVSVIVTASGVLLAALIGAFVAFAALRPLRRLSTAVSAVTATGDLTHHVDVRGRDELSEVAAGFNAMLDTLSKSLAQQRQLVADASHVLRTPLTTVRTNVEVLRREGELDVDERAELIGETVTQLAELTRLLNNLIELARGEEEQGAYGELRLDELLQSVVDEARRNHPAVDFELDTVPSIVWGSPDWLAKAFDNLVQNAAKWTKPGTPVEIVVGHRTVTVRDHGPGVDVADIPYIFDRFYRSLSARGVPGSGLGLAIAKQAVESHGGHISVRNAEGDGAEFAVELPVPPEH